MSLEDRDVCVSSMLKILNELDLSPEVLDVQNKQIVISVQMTGQMTWISVGAHSYRVGDDNDVCWEGDDPLQALVALSK